MAFQGKSIEWSDDQIKVLGSTLSRERLSRYVEQSGGDQRAAIRLYERNTALSEALHGVVQGLEIALRNKIHLALSGAYGVEWYWSEGLPQLEHPLVEMLEDAIEELERKRRPVSPGNLVAALSLGFWTGLIGRKYEKMFWVPCLHRVFPSGSRRADIAKRLERIRQLRNRIAHHEPVIHYGLEIRYKEIIECTGWICPTTAKWVASTNSFPSRWWKS